jgi:hypothetical protein
MTRYHDRRMAGHYDAGGPAADEPEAEPEATPLPRTHAELDELAAQRGHTWTVDGLTVAGKQAELGE